MHTDLSDALRFILNAGLC